MGQNWWNQSMEFSQKVEQEKQSRILNIKNWLQEEERPLKLTDYQIKEFFAQRWVNHQSISEFLKLHYDANWVENVIESKFPKLDFINWKEEIISDILAKWPFENPQDLVWAISNYIKENVTYNPITGFHYLRTTINKFFLDAIENKSYYEWVLEKTTDLKKKQQLYKKLSTPKILPEKNLDHIMECFSGYKKSLPDNFRQLMFEANWTWKLREFLYKHLTMPFIDNDWIKFSEVHIKWIRDILTQMETDPSYDQNTLLWLKKILDKNKPQELLSYCIKEYSNSDKFRTIFREIHFKWWDNWNYSNDVYWFLKDVKSWVCRHFPSAAKEIFNEIVKRWEWVEFSKDAELLYVAIPWHSYNVLLYMDENWLQKKYLDLTSHILWWKLFFENKWKNPEIWAENNWETLA